MCSNKINDPLLDMSCELIIEEKVKSNGALCDKLLNDVRSMTDETRESILAAMFRMHKYFEEECGDLDVSLNTPKEIPDNTESWYVILDESSTQQDRIIRYHYKANWETSHGVEVIVVNSNKLIYVGNCGYVSSVGDISTFKEEGFNFV